MTKWVVDTAGNKCSIEYFGTESAARKALGFLVACTDCKNCKNAGAALND